MSARITTAMLQRNLLQDLNRANRKLSQTQDTMSSGKAISKPSDDPAGASKVLSLRETLRGTQQHQTNAGDGLSWADATEEALRSMTDVIQRASELTTAGGSEQLDSTSRESIAAEIDQLTEALKQQANVSYGGRHLLAGTRTDVAPYGAGDTYQGNNAQIAREIGPGVSVAINTTADTILGNGQAAGDNKLLDVLRDIHDHLLAGDTASLRGTDTTRLADNLDNLLTVRAANGALSNRLESAQSRLASLEEMTTKTLSDTEDADMAKTLIDFNTQTAAYQAALRAGANIVQSSLMDFLH